MSKYELSVPDVVFIVFLILKLIGVITWSWWWVFSPYWISILYVFLLNVDK